MLSKIVIYSYLLMLIVGMCIPSDANHGLFAPKSLVFLNMAFFFGLYVFFKGKMHVSQAWAALLLLAGVLLAGIWYMVGLFQEELFLARPFDQFKLLMITLFVPLSAWYLIKDGLLSSQTILRTVLIAHCGYCTFKVGLTLLHLAGALNLWTLLHLTNLRFMSMHISGELSRIQTSVDIVTPFLVYFMLQSDLLHLNFSKKFQAFFLVMATLSTLLSFSRFLLFAFGCSLLFHILTVTLGKQIRFWFFTLIAVMITFLAVGYENLQEIASRRLFSQETSQSDDVRTEQINALLRACDKKPLLGYGLGGYTPECIRDTTLFHNYEVQWVAFLMQFGLMGLSFLLIPCLLLGWRLISPPFNWSRSGYCLLFGLWLASGFTNPFLISLTSGIIYTNFLLASEITNSYSRVEIS